jgi:hypothetical protein
MKRLLLLALLSSLAASALAQAPPYSLEQSAFTTEKNPPNLTGTIVDYITPQAAGKVLQPPCSASGPPTWRDLCRETLDVLGISLSTVTPVANDLCIFMDASASNIFVRNTCQTVVNAALTGLAQPVTRVIANNTTAVTFSNTVSESEIVCASGLSSCSGTGITIPANTLGSAGSCQLDLYGGFLQNSGAATGATFKVYWNAASIYEDATGAATFAANATTRPMHIRLVLYADGDTTHQRMEGQIDIGQAGAVTTGRGDLAAGGSDFNWQFSTGTSSANVDQTADRVLRMTYTGTSATATQTWTTNRSTLVCFTP